MGANSENPNVEAVWQVLGAGLPVIIAILGAAVTLWPPIGDNAKLIWLGSFAFLGIAAFIVVLQEQRSNRRNHRRLMAQITGGKSFCYLTIDASRSAANGTFGLVMNSTAPLQGVNYWISPAAANRDKNNPLYFSLDRRKPAPFVVHEGIGRAWDGALPAGDYIIEIEAVNGLKFWIEYLSIMHTDSEVEQSVRVEHVKTGEIVFNSKIPGTMARTASEDAHQAERRLARQKIREELGAYLEAGRQLMNECGDEAKQPPNGRADQWASEIERYFQGSLDSSFIARFRDHSGLPMTANSISSQAHRQLWAGIWVRTSRLQEFIREYLD